MTKKKYIDLIFIYFLFVLSVFVIYFIPRYLASILQIFFFIAFYRSKRDYFWLAFVFIVENFPGGLFSRYTNDIHHTFSLLPYSPLGTLYFWMIFVIIAFIKSLKKNKIYKNIFEKYFIILFVYFTVLVIFSGIYKYTAAIRTLLPWLFLFIFPRLLRTEEDFAGFFRIIFSFAFFVAFTQIFQVVFGITIAEFFGNSEMILVTEELRNVARPADGIFIPFLSIFGALYYMILKKKYFRRNYLILVIGLSIFSIYITATRSWMIGALFIFGFYVFFIEKEKVIILRKFVIPSLIVFIIIQSFPDVRQQVYLAKKRYETIELLLEGDPTAGGTLRRLDVRGPKVMEKFSERPFFGWGYGTEANNYSDGHVGNQNLLMHTGIVGYSLWALLWLIFILKMLYLNKSLKSNNYYKNIPKLFIIMLLGILIINVSTQWFDYLLSFLHGFTILFLFTFASFVYTNARIKIYHSFKIQVQQKG